MACYIYIYIYKLKIFSNIYEIVVLMFLLGWTGAYIRPDANQEQLNLAFRAGKIAIFLVYWGSNLRESKCVCKPFK